MNAFQTQPFTSYQNQFTYSTSDQIEHSNVYTTNCDQNDKINYHNCSVTSPVKLNNNISNRFSDTNYPPDTSSSNLSKPQHFYTELVSPFTYLNEVELEVSDSIFPLFNTSQQIFTSENKPDYGLISHSGFAYGTPSPPSSACSSNGPQSYHILNKSIVESFHEEDLNNSLVICQLEDSKQGQLVKNTFNTVYSSRKSQETSNLIPNTSNEYNFLSKNQNSTPNTSSMVTSNVNYHENLDVLQNLVCSSEQHLNKLNNCFFANESHSINQLNYGQVPSLTQPQLEAEEKNVKYISNSNTKPPPDISYPIYTNNRILNANKPELNQHKVSNSINLGIILGYDNEGRPIRSTVNKKERRRTLSINNAFSNLRECIPNVPSDTKLSKIKTLRLATSYISYLMELLDDSSSCVNMNGKRNRLMMTCEDFKVDLQRFKGRSKSIHLLHEMEKKSTQKSFLEMNNIKTEHLQTTVDQSIENENAVIKQESTCHKSDNNLCSQQMQQAKNVQLYHQVPSCKIDYRQQINKRIKGRTGWPQVVWASELQETQT